MADPGLGGWALAAVLPALALAHEKARGAGRRHRLNRAMHELRRPLQALALSADGERLGLATSRTPGPGFLDLALDALEDLDRDVNGAARRRHEPQLVCFRELTDAAVERWSARAGAPELKLYWDAGPAMLLGEPERLAQALDNLIANAVEHGAPPLVLTASRVAGRVRITLSNGAGDGAVGRGRSRNPRRGHGLDLVNAVARAHGGRFVLRHSPQGVVAAIELPLAGPEAAAAA